MVGVNVRKLQDHEHTGPGDGGTLGPGVVDTEQLADGAVTAEKIADPIAITQEYEVEVITAQDSVTVLAEEGGVEYSDAIDVRDAKSIFLTIINHTAVHNLQAIILTSYDGEHFDTEDTSNIILTVDINDEQESCAITPGMAYLKVGLLKHFAGNTTASSILTIRK